MQRDAEYWNSTRTSLLYDELRNFTLPWLEPVEIDTLKAKLIVELLVLPGHDEH